MTILASAPGAERIGAGNPIATDMQPAGRHARRTGRGWRRAATGIGWACAALTLLASLDCMGGKSEVVQIKEPKKCTQQSVHMTVLSAPVINPTDDGETRPVILRVYQLKNDVALQNASFEQIWKNDKATFGEDMLWTSELPIYPASRAEVKFEQDDAAQHVVAVALFRNPKGKSWFTSWELPPSPTKGECGQGGAAAPAPSTSANCDSGLCDKKGGKPPTFVIWIEGNRVDAGEDRLEDFPSDTRRVQSLELKGGVPGAPRAPSANAPNVNTPSQPSAPDLPSQPSAPDLPSQPSAPSPGVPGGF